MRRLAITLIAVALLAGSATAQRKLTRAENDSVVCALATIWGEYLHNKAAKSSDKDFNDEYMRGLTAALDLADENTPYFTGLQDGIVIDSRVTQVEQMGGFSIDRKALAAAFQRAAKGRGTGFTRETADRYMNYIITAASADQAYKQRSEAFIDSIAAKPGVKSEMTGLLWEVIKPSDGARLPNSTQSVKINYVGRLFDGTVFDDQNAERPVVYQLRDLLPGFVEGLFIMTEGSTYRFYLPPRLAYGEAGISGVIPPNSALVFDVTLLEIDPDKNKSDN